MAMIRNKTICALSDFVIVIQAAKKGGSISSGNEALKMRKPLFVIAPDSPDRPGYGGNFSLIKKGAYPLDLDRETEEVDFSPVFDPANTPKPPKEPEQESLF